MGELVISEESKVKQLIEDCKIPQHMLGDAFIALLVAVLREWSLSSDVKYFIMQGMIGNLQKMGYETEMEQFTLGLNELMKRYNKKNDFMG